MSSQNELHQKLLMFTVVRLCHVFNTVLNSMNISDAVLSCLRGYSSNFNNFYEALQLFLDTFRKELESLGDLKLMTENLEAENKFNFTIQFNYGSSGQEDHMINVCDPYTGTVSPDLRDRKKRILVSDDGELKWKPEFKKRRVEEFSEVNVEAVQELMTKFDIDEDVSLKKYIVEFRLDKPACVAEQSHTPVNNEEYDAKQVDADNFSVEAPMLHDPDMTEEAVMNQAISGNDDISIALEEFSFEENNKIDDCSEINENRAPTLNESNLVDQENNTVNNCNDLNLKEERDEEDPMPRDEMSVEDTTRTEDLTENTVCGNLEKPTLKRDPDYNDQFSSIDDEMERDFQQKLAEQNRLYEEKLANIRRKRIEKNVAAQKEIKAIEERIRRANH